jgi:hypothetical protein
MSIAIMITSENLPQLKYISSLIRENGDWSGEMKDSLKLVDDTIDVLTGSFQSVPFAEEPLN